MKRKSDFAHKLLGLRDIDNVRVTFFYPRAITESTIQLLLLPFISYNLSYPIESTKFAFLNRLKYEGIAFQFVGKSARAHIYFESSTKLNNREELKQRKRKKETILRKEFQKAYRTVYNDLDSDPKALWYNDIKTVEISSDILKNISEHFPRQILIVRDGSEPNKNGKIPISLIELPNTSTAPALINTSPLYS